MNVYVVAYFWSKSLEIGKVSVNFERLITKSNNDEYKGYNLIAMKKDFSTHFRNIYASHIMTIY